MMVYGNFGWTHGDPEARSSPWEAFWGCLYLWKSLKKEINHTPSRNHSGCWRARQCRAGFVPGPPWVLLNRMWKPGGCRAAKKLNLKGVRKTRGRDSERANEGEQLLKQQGGGPEPTQSSQPRGCGEGPAHRTPPAVGGGRGRQHPPPAGAMARSPPRTRASSRASAVPTVPARIRLQNLPFCGKDRLHQYEARSFPVRGQVIPSPGILGCSRHAGAARGVTPGAGAALRGTIAARRGGCKAKTQKPDGGKAIPCRG